MKIVLLPGLDGTGDLLAAFAARCGARIVSYPPDRELTFDDYVALAARDIERDTIVIAESFSGPIAVRIAATREIAALVLAGSFVTPPLPKAIRMLPLTTLARVQVPDWLLSFCMLGRSATAERVRALRAAIGKVEPRVLASRLRIALSVDERANLAKTGMPLVDLRGTADLLVRRKSRRPVLAARPDPIAVDIDAPHALLFTHAVEAWPSLRSYLLQ